MVSISVQLVQYLGLVYRQKFGVYKYQVSTVFSVLYSQDSDSVQAGVWCVRVNRQNNIKCNVQAGLRCY